MKKLIFMLIPLFSYSQIFISGDYNTEQNTILSVGYYEDFKTHAIDFGFNYEFLEEGFNGNAFFNFNHKLSKKVILSQGLQFGALKLNESDYINYGVNTGIHYKRIRWSIGVVHTLERYYQIESDFRNTARISFRLYLFQPQRAAKRRRFF